MRSAMAMLMVCSLLPLGCRDSAPPEPPEPAQAPASQPASGPAERLPGVLLPVEVQEGWGYMDTTGRMRLEPVYQQAEPFAEGLAAVLAEGLWGFVDRRGRRVIDPRYQAVGAGVFSQGRASVMLKGLWGAIDRTGRLVVPALYQAPVVFGEGGLAPLRQGRVYGYIDLEGRMRITPRFSYARPFRQGLAAVQVGGVWQGRRLRGGVWGYIDLDGAMAIEPDYAQAGDFSAEGLAAVYRSGRSSRPGGTLQFAGYIDRQGEVAIPAGENAHGDRFSEGLAAVQDSLTGLWGYIDTSGERVIAAELTRVGAFAQGRAPAGRYVAGSAEHIRWGYLDTSGRWVVEPRFDQAGTFREGFAPVRLDGRAGYVNLQGQVVWPGE